MIKALFRLTGVILIAMFASSCGMEGQFGFKKFGEDTFRRMEGTPEFSTGDPVDWVYVFKKRIGERTIGIVYQKKELVWVDVLTRTGKVDETSRVIYGTIKDLPPGDYTITLTDLENNNKEIDSKGFKLFEPEEDEE